MESVLCVFEFESAAGTVPFVRGLSTDSATEMSSGPDFARRQPLGLPVHKR